MSSPTLANLQTKLANAEARAKRLLFNTWVMPMSARHYKTPHLTGEYSEHTRLVTETIPAIKRQIANRRARNARNERKRVARARQVMRKYTRKLHARIYRPPSVGGAMYRRTAASTGLRRTRSVGTSMSPNRRSPKRRNTGTSP